MRSPGARHSAPALCVWGGGERGRASGSRRRRRGEKKRGEERRRRLGSGQPATAPRRPRCRPAQRRAGPAGRRRAPAGGERRGGAEGQLRSHPRPAAPRRRVAARPPRLDVPPAPAAPMAVARKIKTLLTVNILVFVGIILFSVYCRIQDRSQELVQIVRSADRRVRSRGAKVGSLADRESILQRLDHLEEVVYNQLNGTEGWGGARCWSRGDQLSWEGAVGWENCPKCLLAGEGNCTEALP